MSLPELLEQRPELADIGVAAQIAGMEVIPTDVVEGRENRIHRMPPTADRWKLRSTTYAGIAAAMGQQWGALEARAAA